MEEAVPKLFKELLQMTSLMVNDIMPDMLLQLDLRTLEALMNESQEASNSLQVLSKLCRIISRKKFSLPSVSPELHVPLERGMSVVSVQPAQLPQVSSAGDNKSTISNFSDLSTHSDDVWKGLLTEARIWFITHNKEKPHVYYCGICNKQAKASHIWEAHLGGKNHVKLVADIEAVKFVCGTCGLHVCGTIGVVNYIMSSEEHEAFDSLVCASRPASAVHSVTSRRSGEFASKGQEPELSDDSVSPNLELSGQSSTKINAPVVNPNPAAQSTSKVPKIFQNTEIHTDFVHITNIISGYIVNHEPFAIAYCRPCEMICESKQLWQDHKGTTKHRGKMKSKHYNNILCRCLQCEFVVTASVKIATTYMKYHIENCHHQSTKGIKLEEYMEFRNLALGEKTSERDPESKASSFKGSSETVYSVRGSVTDLRSSRADLSTPPSDLCPSSNVQSFRLNVIYSGEKGIHDLPVVDKDVSQSAEHSSSSASTSQSTGATKKTSANPYRSSNTKPPYDQVSYLDPSAQINHLAQIVASPEPPFSNLLADLEFTFLQMLYKKEESFQKDTRFKLFTALCTVCKHDYFSSPNAWNQHVLAHTKSNSCAGKEIACTQCHSRFFGCDGDIFPFVNHDYHIYIDSMFSW